MLEGAGDDDGLSFQRLRGRAVFYPLLDLEILQQRVHLLHRRRILEVAHEVLCEHRADAVHLLQLLHACCPQLREIISEVPAEDLRVCEANAGDPEAIHDAVKLRMAGALRGCHQILIALLTEALHRHDLGTITVEMEDIAVVMDEAMRDELLQCLLAEALDVQCIAAHEK